MIKGRILVVDDEEIARRNLTHVLEREGYVVDSAAEGAAALALLGETRYQLLLTDLRMPGIDGLELLRQTKAKWPETEVIMITAHANASSAVEAMTNGAFYYVEKPFRLPDVRKIVGEATQKAALRHENASLKAALDEATSAPRLVSANPEMLAVLAHAESIAATDVVPLLVGEIGSGRQALAQHIHDQSRRPGPFACLDCAARSEPALAGDLFGVEPDSAGQVELAAGGTLFLDDIDTLSPALQLRLLRLLENGEFSRGGSAQARRADVRVIAAATRDLAPLVESGAFRQDLLFRLNVVTLHLPPLRRRRGDIPLLAMHFLKRASLRLGKQVTEIAPDAFDRLLGWNFPGNLFELENVIERGVAQADGSVLTAELLPPEMGHPALAPAEAADIKTLEQLEREHILKTLEHTSGNRALAAQLLGIDRVSLWRKLRRFNEEV